MGRNLSGFAGPSTAGALQTQDDWNLEEGLDKMIIQTLFRIPSGELTFCHGKWPFIVSFPIKNGDFPLLC